jgi:hypothetical protein
MAVSPSLLGPGKREEREENMTDKAAACKPQRGEAGGEQGRQGGRRMGELATSESAGGTKGELALQPSAPHVGYRARGLQTEQREARWTGCSPVNLRAESEKERRRGETAGRCERESECVRA